MPGSAPDEQATLRTEDHAGQAALLVELARALEAQRERLELANAQLELQAEQLQARNVELACAHDELATLVSIAAHLTANLEVGALLRTMADRLHDIIDYSGLAVYRLEGAELSIVEYRGPVPRHEALMMRLPLAGAPGIEESITRREPVILADVQASPPPARRGAAHPVLRRLAGTDRCWLVVPLIAHDRPIGALRLTHPEPGHFTAHHARLAIAFAGHAAVAMENARLYEQAKEMAAVGERQRLARELHDAVSQTLFSASLIADVLPTLYARDPELGQERLAELRDLSRGAIAEMRILLLELRPASLLEMDLADLLRQLAQAISGRSGVPVNVTLDRAAALPGEVQVALYRIAQEALHNVVKHGRARRAAITLSCSPGPDGGPGAVELQVADDGCGFDPGQVPPGRLGLQTMIERAEAIGAALAIDSRPGAGTRIAARWRNS